MKKSRIAILVFVGALIPLVIATGCYVANAQHGTVQPPSAPQADIAPTAVPIDAGHVYYDPSTPPASPDKVKEITLVAQDKVQDIAAGVPYDTWTFNGTVPGPVLRVRQGDQVKLTVVNKGTMEHSIDFHAAQTPWDVNYKAIKPGESYTFTWTANYPGVFMYHCGTPPVIAHLSNGMYGAIIVDPAAGLPPAREYVLIQSEFYAKKGADGIFQYDGTKALAVNPDYVVFNGYANQYQDKPLTANPGERIRIWVLNAGPSEFSAFHIVGAIFDKAYADGDPKNEETGRQTVMIPPGGGYMVELTVPDAGIYPFVTHSFADASKGASGFLQVGDAKMQPGMSH